MTRETKIGLLVGLAFIIVIGILLSEHLTTATETPAAALALAGGNVRQGVSAPGSRQTPPAVAPTTPAEPLGPIPTRNDLSPVAPPIAQVNVNGPATGNGPAGPIVITPAPPQPPVTTGDGDVVVTRLPIPGSLEEAARRHGEELVPVGPRQAPVPPGPSSTNPTNTRQYKAQAGDTLSRIASLLPGGNVKANREAIVKLNPTLQKDPNKIIAGRTYLLPLDGKSTDAPKTDTVVVKAPAPTGATYTYVVKPGDSLSKIALEQLGTTAAVAQIKELNQDVLKGGDTIQVDMKLKLPAKPVAAGN